MIRCHYCQMTSGYADIFDKTHCCDYGEYLLDLIERFVVKPNPQLIFNSRGDLIREKERLRVSIRSLKFGYR